MLNEKALIVNLNIKNWTGRKQDKQVTKEVNNIHNAKDSGNFNKLLIAKEFTDPLQKVISKARTFHYDNTLEWGKNGDKLLPNENYVDYTGEMGKFKDEFDREVNNFIQRYDSAILEAQVRLGTMFRHSDYYRKDDLYSKFGFKVELFPVPSTDFRVGLGDDELEKLKSSVEDSINERLANAVQDIWDRIKDQLNNMKKILSNKDSKVFNSLFENLKDLTELIPKLNVTDDKNIANICNEMKKLIVSADDVRSSNTLRATKAEEVDQIMNKFSSYFK